ncbi:MULTISPECIES: shikimate kinase [unclassified Lentimicrobium]|uniref:shikimate kinase n=1 Tax=unclassified Lentimicrobium TaxID=2677434 RepID=UPI00155386E9|nr:MULTISPECIES: shikimate kinase [unclassified Lentimicrobium]NPD46471.1 shikimate kinase [Lentimicrobium sp. S6]NPD85977.1 shikimate kinase [Lentimicrobium sp. L6]
MLIFIIGMMGSGKTSLGKKLARQLDYDFIDIDETIESEEGKTISELFDIWGEEEFRIQEHSHLKKIGKLENGVISTGGGLACYHDNMSLMNQLGETLFLYADSAFLASRLKQGKAGRPLIAELVDEELPGFVDALLKKRNPFYEQAKHIIPSKDLKVSDVLELFLSKGLSF